MRMGLDLLDLSCNEESLVSVHCSDQRFFAGGQCRFGIHDDESILRDLKTTRI